MAQWCSGAVMVAAVLLCGAVVQANYSPHGQGLSDALMLREMVARMGSGLADPASDYLPLQQGLDAMGGPLGGPLKPSMYERPMSSPEMDLQEALEMRDTRLSDNEELARELDLSVPRELRDDDLDLSVPRDLRDDLELDLDRSSPYGGELSMHPSLRDHEYMSHGHLLGNMLAQFPPGSSYGTMRIKPSGAGAPSAVSERKTDGVLPAYCNPPNPCPLGYTAADGCEEVFQNTAAYSRNYQSQQQCMCDTEHMFECPDGNRDSEIGALARSIQNEGVKDSTLDRIMDEIMQPRNPYLQGPKLPVAAKKGVLRP